jgi:hypothetical protein
MIDKMCNVYCINLGRVFKKQNNQVITLVDSRWITSEPKMIVCLETFSCLGIHFLEA